MYRGMAETANTLFWACLYTGIIFIPLGMWKAVELFLLVIKHIHIN